MVVNGDALTCTSSGPGPEGAAVDHTLIIEAIDGVACSSGSDAVVMARLALGQTRMPAEAVSARTPMGFDQLQLAVGVQEKIGVSEIDKRGLHYKANMIARLACDVTIGPYALRMPTEHAAQVLRATVDSVVAIGATKEDAQAIVGELVTWLWESRVRSVQEQLPPDPKSPNPEYMREIAAQLGIELRREQDVLAEQQQRLDTETAWEASKGSHFSSV